MAVLGIFALAVMELLAPFIPRWLGAEPEVYPLAVTYLRMYCLGLPFATALAAVFRHHPLHRRHQDASVPQRAGQRGEHRAQLPAHL